MNRPTFEEWCMQIAETVALRSPDENLQVGCILVSKDFTRIRGWGYNGPVAGARNERKSNKPGQSSFIHSEINCLIGSPQEKEGYLFVTSAPCEDCARVIANSQKVKRVYYKKEYRIKKGIDILLDADIEVIKL